MTEGINNELAVAIYTFLKGQRTITALLADGAAGIHEDAPPANANLPALVYNQASGVPSYTLGEGRSHKDFVYQVKGICKGDSSKAAQLIADAVEAVLSDGALTLPGRNVMVVEHIGDTRLNERADGVRYNHRGGLYRAMVEA